MATARFARKPSSATRISDVDKNQLYRFKPTRGDGKMRLADLVGQGEVDSIVANNRIEFLATGDTGKGMDTKQQEVVEAMARDVNVHSPATGPILFLNLGDIIYGPGKSSGYANKFYRPNKSWLQPVPGFQGVILGIPGNHDGEVRDERDKPSLAAFTDNFCQPKGKDSTMAASFQVKMPNQPGAYWWLEAPFLDLIGLYSNAAEDFGVLGVDARDTHQQDWLRATLKSIAKTRKTGGRKSLVFATHHPPYSQGFAAHTTGHPGSPKLLKQIDEACSAAGLWPDMFISGHSHNYQLYKRRISVGGGKMATIPYIIAGTGGIGSQPVPSNINAKDPTGTVTYASGRGKLHDGSEVYGYLRIRATASIVQSTFVQTIADHRNPVETVAIDLATGDETSPQII
jgi:hypothetical protein